MTNGYWFEMKRHLAAGALCLFSTLGLAPANAADIRTGTVAVNDTVLHYREAGNGAPVIFLHAYLLNSHLWLDQLSGLSDVCRCIAIDLRGFGKSAPYTATYLDPYLYADDVIAFIEAQNFDEPVHLVGMSVGAFIGGLVYDKVPDKIASMTIISAPFDWTPDPVYARYQKAMARLAVVEGKDAVFRRFDEYIDGPTTSLHMRARYKSMLEDTRTEMLVAHLTNGGTTKPRPDLYDKIDVPVLLPIGTADSVVSLDLTETMRKKFKDARVVEIENAGRLLSLENADALNEALRDFWRDVETN